MALLLPLLVLAATATPTLDLDGTLMPADSKMRIRALVEAPRELVKGGRLTFFLGAQMGVPKVGADGAQIVPEKRSERDKDVTYSIPISSSEGPVKLEFEYESQDPKGNVYFLSPKECFAGGYNTLWFPSVGKSRRMVGRMVFHTPASFLVKASGRAISSSVAGDQRTSEFRIEKPTVPTFASAPFTVVSMPGKVPVTLYLLKPRPGTEQFAQGTADVLGVLQDEFGPYPYPDFAIIETPSPESSQLGFTGASFEGMMFGDSNNIDGGFNLAYFGHEMSHQWWGNLVQLSSDRGSFVFSEGFAQFGSLQAVRNLAGVPLAKEYRINGYPGYSDWQCLRGAVAYGATGNDRPLTMNPPINGVFQHQLANSKGFLAWETLAQTMGHPAMRAALRDIARTHAWSSISWDEIWRTLQKHTTKDLKTFREQWFERPGLPTVWTNWSQSGKTLSVTLKQKAPTYRLGMPLVITFRDGTTLVKPVEFETESELLTISVSKPVLSATLDPEHETLHSTPELDAQMHDWRAYCQADFFDSLVGKRDSDGPMIEEALKSLPNPDRYGAEFLLRFTLGGILRRQNKLTEAREQLERALACPVRRDDFVPLAYLRLALIAQAEKKPDEVKMLLGKLRSAESVLPYPSGALTSMKIYFPSD